MPVTQFPDPRKADADGLVAFGGDLHPETLLSAYRSGIFPWPMGGRSKTPMTWFSPDPRAILEFDRLHIPRSLERARKTTPFKFTVNQAFKAVIHACAHVSRPGQPGTWITSALKNAYVDLHKLGHAHSVEVWDASDELVGGIYGVDVDGVFAGESMFHLKPNSSKLALLHLIGLLSSAGALWMDIQMLTPHMQALGAREISRDDFLIRLGEARQRGSRPKWK